MQDSVLKHAKKRIKNMIKKTCICCKKAKKLDEFYKHKTTKDGRINKCKTCKREYAREYQRNKEKKTELKVEPKPDYNPLISSILSTNDFFKPATIKGGFYGRIL
jgi:hypothetical protein